MILKTVEILNVPIACLDQQALLDQALTWSKSPGRRVIYYANANTLNLATRDAEYHHILCSADLIYADGISMVWSSQLLGGCRLQKLTSADWIFDLAAGAAAQGSRWYLLGGKPGVAGRAAECLLSHCPSLTIVGTCDGFFMTRTVAQVLQEISECKPNIVLVGMGAPLQERWIATHAPILADGVWWGVGALFDYLAGDERRVPSGLKRLGLEWFWRMLQDPAGKWRRYLIGNPVFMLRVFLQVVKNWANIGETRK